MYKALYKIQQGNIDKMGNKIFTPFINCYIIHSAIMFVNGVAGEQDVDFIFNDNYTEYNFDFNVEEGEPMIGDSDSVILDINYFYIRKDNSLLDFLIGSSFSDSAKSSEIVSKHYIEGQFSLDNGLYKNAAMNFGTVLEGLLNESLADRKLASLIDNYGVTPSKRGRADKTDMHFIRNLRNKVHPERISATQDISRKDAIDARNKLELILNNL